MSTGAQRPSVSRLDLAQRIAVAVLPWQAASTDAQPLRHQVFCIEQGIDAALEHDAFDALSQHALARAGDGAVIGTGRLLPDGHIGRMAVKKEARNQGVGAALLHALIIKATALGHTRIALNAQIGACSFYRRHGFTAVGAPYLEVGIEHQSMERLLVADENLWLEDIDGEGALDWVRHENRRSQALLEAEPGFDRLLSRLESIFESDQRIPVATVRGAWLYNFWQDAKHVRGIWRRTSLESYRSADPQWQLLLDLDGLSAHEASNWVWGGAQVLNPDYSRALLRLSVGGGDAAVLREFDLDTLSFVVDGFTLPAGKSQASWLEPDALLVCADFGAGSVTTSGYPRIAKLWRRGTPLEHAEVVFEAEASDVMVRAYLSRDYIGEHMLERQWLSRLITFQTSKTYLRRNGQLHLIEVPLDAEVGSFADQLIVTLKSDWVIGTRTWPQGALLAIGFESFLAGDRAFEVLFEPAERLVLGGWFNTRSMLVVVRMDNLEQRVETLKRVGGSWQRAALHTETGVTSEYFAYDAEASDDLFLAESGPLLPTRLSLHRLGAAPEILKRLPALFDASGLVVNRYDARSPDGTLVPYMVVGHPGSSASSPTLLSGYGGFEIARLPLGYGAGVGAAWLERGGRYVVAGIRGGGEFGPAWHLDAIRDKKQNCFDDFIAVARDLVARGLARPEHLGIQGGSNGGLLVGAVMLQAPEVIGAVVCQVPLLDMQRYHKLLAGASWVAEYGDPDLADDWAFISRYSPYQRLDANATYPPVLFATSTRDDRVHPGHARKMAARMQAMGHGMLYFENIEGGHAGAANQRQAAYLSALSFSFLWRCLS